MRGLNRVPGLLFACLLSMEAGAADSLWVSPALEGDRRPSASISDLMELVPPTQDYSHQSPVPQEWNTVWTVTGDGDEWERPVRITSSPPGWTVDEWEDVYAGTVEMRAFQLTAEPLVIFSLVCDILRPLAAEPGVSLLEEPGMYILVHRLPCPEDRRGDWDFWVCVMEDGLEYGVRVRSFYGEPLYCWDRIPEEARATSLPETAGEWSEAFDLLLLRLASTGAYDAHTLDRISLSPGYLDDLEEGSWRDYFDITVREVHRPGETGDPDTAPVLDRFRVYSRCGEVLWWHPLAGMFMPFDSMSDPLSSLL